MNFPHLVCGSSSCATSPAAWMTWSHLKAGFCIGSDKKITLNKALIFFWSWQSNILYLCSSRTRRICTEKSGCTLRKLQPIMYPPLAGRLFWNSKEGWVHWSSLSQMQTHSHRRNISFKNHAREHWRCGFDNTGLLFHLQAFLLWWKWSLCRRKWCIVSLLFHPVWSTMSEVLGSVRIFLSLSSACSIGISCFSKPAVHLLLGR